MLELLLIKCLSNGHLVHFLLFFFFLVLVSFFHFQLVVFSGFAFVFFVLPRFNLV